MIKKVFQILATCFLLTTMLVTLESLAQEPSSDLNKINSVSFSNNILDLNATKKITYKKSRLTEPDRLVIDIPNAKLPFAQRQYMSRQDESISVFESSAGNVRITILGRASINRKIYVSNQQKSLSVKVSRIGQNFAEDSIVDSEENAELKEYKLGELKDISIKSSDTETEVNISATKSIKYNTYLLRDPPRLAIDLLNIKLTTEKLPTYEKTPHVSGIRVGKAASGFDATRVVVDLTEEDLANDLNTNLLGNKIKLTFKKETKKAKPKKKTGLKVIIDAGHGGYDTGASYGGFQEKDINLVISKKLQEKLEEEGITGILVRDSDEFLSLAERVEITNSVKPDLFISVHANALNSSAIRGVETYYWNANSQKLAYKIHNKILKNIKIPDHHIRKARFYVIKYTPVPAVLAELGFLSNPQDRKLLTNPEIQDKYAESLKEAIVEFLK